jgi:hypothetical protein
VTVVIDDGAGVEGRARGRDAQGVGVGRGGVTRRITRRQVSVAIAAPVKRHDSNRRAIGSEAQRKIFSKTRVEKEERVDGRKKRRLKQPRIVRFVEEM